MCDKKIFQKINEILLNDEKPSNVLNELRKTREFEESIFNIVNKLESIEQDKVFHPEGNVWNHICMVVDEGSKLKDFAEDKRSFVWGTFLHDIGKITNTKWIRGRWRSYDHDKAGAEKAKAILDIVSNDLEFNKRVETLVQFHMHHIYIGKDLPFANLKGLISSDNVNDIILVFICDKLGRGNQTNSEKQMVFKEVLNILEKIEDYTGKKYEGIKIKIHEISKAEVCNHID